MSFWDVFEEQLDIRHGDHGVANLFVANLREEPERQPKAMRLLLVTEAGAEGNTLYVAATNVICQAVDKRTSYVAASTRRDHVNALYLTAASLASRDDTSYETYGLSSWRLRDTLFDPNEDS